MTDLPLILVNHDEAKVLATQEVERLKTECLSASLQISRVSNAEENEICVRAQTLCAEYIKNVNKAEEAVKKPLNERRNQVITLAKELRSEVDAEGLRLAGLAGEFQERERVKQQAILASQSNQLSELEQRQASELAVAQTVEEQDEIRERYGREMRGVMQPMETTRAKGQRLASEIEVTVTDIWALARMYPHCVKIEPRLTELKELIKAIEENARLNNFQAAIPGVTWKRVTKAGVSTREKKPIEIP